MDKYELFLKELTELCRKHDIEICIDGHSEELSLCDALEWKESFKSHDSILDYDYKIIDNYMKNFAVVRL